MGVERAPIPRRKEILRTVVAGKIGRDFEYRLAVVPLLGAKGVAGRKIE
jgi:hypothetical protein